MILPTQRYEKKHIKVNGKSMAYAEVGEGDPIVFIHGNPTSSYLWRNVMPHVEDLGKLIAPDLIGMGDSDKLEESGPDRYRFVEQRAFLDQLLETLGVSHNVTFVVHDWGSALGFDWANRHRDQVKGIAFMESLVQPLTWEDWPDSVRSLFQGFRSPQGEKMILEQNIFVEQVLPEAILRGLSEEEMAVYRRPYRQPGEGRRPTLTWPREIPIEGEPADVVEIVKNYGGWLSTSHVPKLFINAEPGAILTSRQRDFCRSWPNQTELTVKGVHFIQEDSPDEIGQAIADWLESIG